ncbi:MAG: hypothetical protein K8L99_04345 [Anaerolineae bacterium]|nr:hypothetical protein [Anaerolineae bacterium]
MTDTLPEIYCSTQSLEAGEQLFGSATNYEVWFVLEYTRPWGAKAFPESDLEPRVKTRMNSWLESIPKSNILFIRQSGRRAESIRFYVALTTERDQKLYRFDLESYDDLLKFDPNAIIADHEAYAEQRSDEQLYLICTNARRDRCCARYGPAIYRKLADLAGEQVWQCTHLGGHRFAPTALFLPQGVCYGRIHESEVDELFDSNRSQKIYLERCRGRVCYTKPVQAADQMLRTRTHKRHLDDFHLHSVKEQDKNRWQVQFVDQEDTLHTLHIELYATGEEIFTSCLAEEKSPVMKYRLVEAE